MALIKVGDASRLHTIEAHNPVYGDPELTGGDEFKSLDVGQSLEGDWPRRDRYISATRRADSGDVKVFTIELKKEGIQGRKSDDKDNNDNNKRRRQRRGRSGGLSNTDRRKRPVDRLLG